MAKREDILHMNLDEVCDYIMEHFDDPERVICTHRELKVDGKVFVHLLMIKLKTFTFN